MGGLNEMTDDLDTQLVLELLIVILELLQKHSGASIPELSALAVRIRNLKNLA